MEDKYIVSLSPEMIFALNVLDDIFSIDDLIERERKLALYRQRAKALGVDKEAERLIKVYDKQDRELDRAARRSYEYSNSNLELERDGNGRAMPTISNFVTVIENDPVLKQMSLRYNLLTNSPEKVNGGSVEPWTDSDDVLIRYRVESQYHFHSVQKCDDALSFIFNKNSYHPIKDIIEAIQWDGKSRISNFLHKWMKCEDTAYTREVSRLIFAGGINRLYNPGCKFDDMPVLIGTKQGEGKSTIVRWLAIDDSFFTEVTTIEGREGMEAVNGAWICEMGELLALTKAKEVEAIKSYTTRQNDRYREAYGKRTAEHPRQCIFIGTTNKEQFLTDKTGNRRFYPVKVNSTGYELFKHEQECKEYIKQCWAESLAKKNTDEMKPFANSDLLDEIRKKQAEAVEDDWRVGVIEQYLEDKNEVCVRELWLNAFHNEYKELSKKDSIEIGMIMNGMKGWNKVGLKHTNYGRQRCWQRAISAVDEFEIVL